MLRFHPYIAWLAAGILGLGAVNVAPMFAEDFRVENAVYDGDQKEPSSESTTIFHGGTVYDCMKSPAETIVFDKDTGRFTLLNLPRRTRAEITPNKVTTLIGSLQPLAAKSKDPLMRFLAEPKFQEQANDAAGELTLSNPLVNYRLTLAPDASKSVVEQYHEFSDWYARLNALLVPGSRPPFGRLVVNAAVAQRQAMPSKVLLTITSGKGSKSQRTTMRSEHRLIRPLEPVDLERIVQIQKFMGSFKLVSFEQYCKMDPK